METIESPGLFDGELFPCLVGVEEAEVGREAEVSFVGVEEAEAEREAEREARPEAEPFAKPVDWVACLTYGDCDNVVSVLESESTMCVVIFTEYFLEHLPRYRSHHT